MTDLVDPHVDDDLLEDDGDVLEVLVDLDDRVPDRELEERLAGMLEQLTDSPARPAVSKLAADQARTLVWLLDGFTDRDGILSWMQSVSIHSLGQIPDEWFADLCASSPVQSALLEEPWGTLQDRLDVLPPGFAAEIRRGMAVEDLIPAFQAAHKEFRWSAGERIEFLDDEEDSDVARIDPQEQQYPAMRPALGQLAERAEWALSTLLTGFDSPDGLLLWVQSAVAIAHAEVDEEAIQSAYFGSPTREVMLGDDAAAKFWRVAWAADVLLPACNRAAREVADRAGEVIAGEGEPNQDPLGWKA